LKDEAKSKLTEIEMPFKNNLSNGSWFGLTGGQGFSVNALIGLTAEKTMLNCLWQIGVLVHEG